MKKTFLVLCVFTILSQNAFADSVILMIGDGMGKNHVDCVKNDNNLFLNNLSTITSVKTSSANSHVTDSAAAATSYACGIKTNNGYLGIDTEQNVCLTIAEQSVSQGRDVYIISTDNDTGATPSAFYSHVNDRHNTLKILNHKSKNEQSMHIKLNAHSLENETKDLLLKLENETKEFFVMIEAAHIDKASHNNDYHSMKDALVDFDKSINLIYNFVKQRKDVHLFITADHETGGLTSDCKYTTTTHTSDDVYLYTKTSSQIQTGDIENFELYYIMNELLQKNTNNK